jgi:amino acid transporter
MWLLGAFIATCGTVVYMELGTGLPRNGGEKNYLEFVYRRPKFLISCAFMGYTLIMVRSINIQGSVPEPTPTEYVNGKQCRFQ